MKYFPGGFGAIPLPELDTIISVRWVLKRVYRHAPRELKVNDNDGRRWRGLHGDLALVMLARKYHALQRFYGLIHGTPPRPRQAEATWFPSPKRKSIAARRPRVVEAFLSKSSSSRFGGATDHN